MANRFLGLGSGKDGVIDLGSYTQTWLSCSGTSGSTSLSVTGTFSAGDRIFIHQSRGTGVGGYEDNTVASYTTGTITLVHPLLQDYTDSGASQAQVAVVQEASSVSGSLTVGAWDGNVGGIFVMACNGTFSGTVDASGKGYRGGIGYGDGTDYNARLGYTGEGTNGASSRDSGVYNSGNVPASYYVANGNGAGASMTGFDPNHGQGGIGGSNGTQGTVGEQYGGYVGSPGATSGNPELTNITFGGGGGGGSDSGTDHHYTDGGNGAGIIIIYCRTFSSNSQLTAIGNNGTNGPNNQDYNCGGAGAGGSILIKAVSTIIGSSKINAYGGTGGQKNISRSNGGNGGTGRVRVETCSLSGTTNPSASTQTGGHSYCGSLTAIL